MLSIVIAVLAGALGGYLFNVVLYRAIEGVWMFWPR